MIGVGTCTLSAEIFELQIVADECAQPSVTQVRIFSDH